MLRDHDRSMKASVEIPRDIAQSIDSIEDFEFALSRLQECLRNALLSDLLHDVQRTSEMSRCRNEGGKKKEKERIRTRGLRKPLRSR
jgi:hypothetical protein